MRQQLSVLRRALSFNRPRRVAAWHIIIARVAKHFNTRVYDLHVTWHHDPEFQAIWSGSPWNARDAGARNFTLFQLVRYVTRIPGDTVECGAYHGMSSYVILSSMGDSTRTHHIFDSFEGLSAPSIADCVDDPGVFRWKANDLAISEAIVHRNLASFDNIRLHRGWIPERFTDVETNRFCFVHIDVDLYQPTLDSMEFFFPRLNPGGVLLCDDYGFASCPGAKRAVDEFAERRSQSIIHLTTGQAFLIKQ